jgi:soluble lytic murein transglycosylase
MMKTITVIGAKDNTAGCSGAHIDLHRCRKWPTPEILKLNQKRAFAKLCSMLISGLFPVLLLSFVWLSAIMPPRSVAQETTPSQSFNAAYGFYSSGFWTPAKDLFQQALSPDYPLADYSLYYLAAIAFQESAWQECRDYAVRLRQDYPQSIWFHRAELLRIKTEMAEQRYPQVIASLRALRAETNLKPDMLEEAIHLLAQAEEEQGDVYQAYSLFQELRRMAPHSSWSASARKEVTRLRDKLPGVFGLFTATDIADEADRLAREREHGAAEALYRKLLNLDLGPELRLHHLTKLADLYVSIRKRNEALPVLEEIARDFSDSSEAPRALYRTGSILWNRNDNGAALTYFRRLRENYPDSAYAGRAQFAMADIMESQGRNKEAVALYSSLPKRFLNSQVGEDAVWRLAWLHYRNGNMHDSNVMFRTLASKAKEEKYRIASVYWQARTAEKLGRHDTAVRLYRNILDQGDESYYQALAGRALARAGIEATEAKQEKPAPVTEFDLSPYPEAAFHLLRARELTQLRLHALAVRELDEVNLLARQQPRLRLLLIQEYVNNHAFARSVAVAHQLAGPESRRIHHRYPLAYWQLIQDKAQEKDMDPYLVVALIRQESLFDTRARSPAVALGLMQLLPSTAGRVAKKVGLPAPSNDKLFDPEINVNLGTQYLRDLLRRYSNNWHKAIAAYNAGEAAVDRWEREILTDDMEEFVERIPYLETRQYVKLVMRNHRIYKSLYNQNS